MTHATDARDWRQELGTLGCYFWTFNNRVLRTSFGCLEAQPDYHISGMAFEISV